MPHILQPKHTILKQDEVEKILKNYNVSLMQLPKIKIIDPAIPEGANVGDVVKIERKDEGGTHVYYRVVVL
jgi:DNA-directed RNA polymerase subunit H